MKRSGPILLVALLCASAFVRRVQIAAGEQPLDHESLHDITREKSFAADLQGGSQVDNTSLEAHNNNCASLRERLYDFVIRGRDNQPSRKVPIWQLPHSDAFFFVSGMTVDADGAPNAYHPDDTGLDALSNAGIPGQWNGIVTDDDGSPLIQRDGDPFPGYYISCTSLSDHSKRSNDPNRYVNASKIPYITLPQEVADAARAQLGDFAVVMNLRNGKSSFAIYADIGTLGEGSIGLAENLGIRSDAREGGQSNAVFYIVFPDSGNLAPRTLGEIQSEGERLLYEWGGFRKLSSCAAGVDQSALGFGEYLGDAP